MTVGVVRMQDCRELSAVEKAPAVPRGLRWPYARWTQDRHGN